MAKFRPLRTSPRDIDYVASRVQIQSRIMQAFGISPIVVGEIVGSNWAQAAVIEQQYCRRRRSERAKDD